MSFFPSSVQLLFLSIYAVHVAQIVDKHLIQLKDYLGDILYYFIAHYSNLKKAKTNNKLTKNSRGW